MSVRLLRGARHVSLLQWPGADTFDPLTALEQWVEKGVAPQTMIATNPRNGVERPVCAWPKLPYYLRGDATRASSFVCR